MSGWRLVVILVGATGCIEWDSLSDNYNPDARLLFRSGFEPGTQIEDLSELPASNITPLLQGIDGTTDQSWNVVPFAVDPSKSVQGFTLLHVLTPDPGTPAPGKAIDYIVNTLDSGVAHGGDHALQMSILKPAPGIGIQDDFGLPNIVEPIDDVYVRMWMRFGPELADQASADPGYYRQVWRILGAGGMLDAQIRKLDTSDPRPAWHVTRDNATVGNVSSLVPVGRWFPIELYYHRGDSTSGRLVFVADGKIVTDYSPADTAFIGAITNLKFATMQGSNPSSAWTQWVDDFEIWNLPDCKTLPCRPL